jgi:hypothetical protein
LNPNIQVLEITESKNTKRQFNFKEKGDTEVLAGAYLGMKIKHLPHYRLGYFHFFVPVTYSVPFSFDYFYSQKKREGN